MADRQLGLADLLARLLVGGRGEDLRVGQSLLPLGNLLRPLIGEQHAQTRLGPGDRSPEGAQERGPARAGLGEDENPLAEGERAKEINGPHQGLGLGIGRDQPAVRWRRS
jgi:hypothetical protein